MFLIFLPLCQSDRSFKIVGNEFQMDGQPFQYISGSFHYFRQHPSLWSDTLSKMANGGLNAIQTYVPWNLHQPTKTEFVWDGLADLELFLQLCQQYNLYVILRPGPYICGEWDLGGLPYWLLKEDIEFLRTADPVYLSYVDDWFTTLYAKLKRHLYINGGNIIMVQIENEYGSYFACDKIYLKHLIDLAHDNLDDSVLLFTVDNPWDFMAKCGADPEAGAYATVDFGVGDDPKSNFELQRNWNNGEGPYVNTEFYTGWLDHWGSPHEKVSWDLVCDKLDAMLALGASVNLYMYYGGTDFGYYSGANGDLDLWYEGDPTSYDYDAPISEAGDVTYKYWQILEVIKKYRQNIPTYPVKNLTKKRYGAVNFEEGCWLMDVLDAVTEKKVANEKPLSFEELDSPFGFVLYQTVAGQAGLLLGDVSDRAVVLNGRNVVNVAVRPKMISTIVSAGDQIGILAESLGRVNWGWTFQEDWKGVNGDCRIENITISGWTMRTMPLSNLDGSKLKWTSELPVGAPGFVRGYFEVDEVADTFLNPTGLTRGVAFVNGVHVGRYWTIGPQLTLYVRAAFLKVGRNELIVFDTNPADFSRVSFDDQPQLDIGTSGVNGRRPLIKKRGRR